MKNSPNVRKKTMQLFNKWVKRLHLKNLQLVFIKDESFAGLADGRNKIVNIVLERIPNEDILENVILHELGHLKKDAMYCKGASIKEIVNKEYIAERFAYDMLKKYRPETIYGYMTYILGCLFSKNFKKRYTVYYLAYIRLFQEMTKEQVR
jgi:hypothetical protein